MVDANQEHEDIAPEGNGNENVESPSMSIDPHQYEENEANQCAPQTRQDEWDLAVAEPDMSKRKFMIGLLLQRELAEKALEVSQNTRALYESRRTTGRVVTLKGDQRGGGDSRGCNDGGRSGRGGRFGGGRSGGGGRGNGGAEQAEPAVGDKRPGDYMGGRACFKCGQTGHFARGCPLKKKNR